MWLYYYGLIHGHLTIKKCYMQKHHKKLYLAMINSDLKSIYFNNKFSVLVASKTIFLGAYILLMLIPRHFTVRNPGVSHFQQFILFPKALRKLYKIQVSLNISKSNKQVERFLKTFCQLFVCYLRLVQWSIKYYQTQNVVNSPCANMTNFMVVLKLRQVKFKGSKQQSVCKFNT